MDDNFGTYVGQAPLAKQFCCLYMKWLYFPFFDHHIGNSEYTVAELRPAAQELLVRRGTWIHHMGVDLDHLSPNRRSSALRGRLLHKFGASAESVLLLYVGRLVPEKNLSLLFNLLLHLVRTDARDFRLLVVGDGIERKRWETETRQRVPANVLFLGHISDRNVLADLYANADCSFTPTRANRLELRRLRPWLLGLPLIAPNSGGITAYANGENAWLLIQRLSLSWQHFMRHCQTHHSGPQRSKPA
jgi:phosphatidylinositol alpha 1,6-mannosyltransferase